MRPYQYRCNDYSLITPLFKQWIISPLIRFIPWGIPANIITIISNLFIYLGLYLSMFPRLGIFTPIFIAACLIIYLIGDHLDGMQAKRTGTGSALGEFCDHYLDAFNNGIIVFIMFTVFEINQPLATATVLLISYLAHMSVFYEQFKTGWLTFERIGSLEGVLLSALLIGLTILDPFHAAMNYRVAGLISVAEAIIAGSTVGAFLTFIQTARRTPDIRRGYWIFALLLTVVCVCGVIVLNNFQLFVILTLYASLYIGWIMYAHLIDGRERMSDWITPAFLLICALSSLSDYIFLTTVVYLTARIIHLIQKAFSSLNMYWVWQNPPR
jgi:phosphatidylglycerophosphate synthase